MRGSYWNDGSNDARKPRMVHGINDIVYLVSAVFVCDKRHKMLAHDESILQLLPKSLIPFILSHQTGFTKELSDLCTTLCKRGINFYNMESLILEKRWECFVQKQDMLSDASTKIDFFESPMSNVPSDNMLAKCFLTGFLSHEKVYLCEMANVPVGESISFDHTFKIASNIGYTREDKKWITEYDSAFFVLNDKGQVLTWQLTKGTAFAEIEWILQSLTERSIEKLKTVYIQ